MPHATDPTNLPFEIPGSGGETIHGDALLPPRDPADSLPAPPVVVCVHGFKGFRRWGFWPSIADSLAAAGIACVRYDASHNGVGAGGLDFDRKDLFERNTFGREEEDLAAVLAALRAGALTPGRAVDAAALGLLAHSRGGAVAIVRAASDPAVRAVAALAPTSTTLRYAPGLLAAARRDGFLPIVNTRTNEILRMGADALDELDARTDLHDVAASHAARLACPLLVAHGTADTSVPQDEGRRLAEAAPRGRFVTFDGADHVLGCRHPWAGPTPAFDAFLRLVAQFFVVHLRGADGTTPA